jgi:Beta-ketoacyl synthase, N-terminal domain
MRVYVSGATLVGPGIGDRETGIAVLRGEKDYAIADYLPPPPAVLSSTERRRTSPSVRLALHAATQSVQAAAADPATLRTVFGTSNGDGQVVHAILETLSGPDRLVSPTQFHNSVHNAAAGYWCIGAGVQRPSVSIGCHDYTFAAALLEAATQTVVEREPTLLCVFDMPMPPPLGLTRKTMFPLAVAIVLSPATVESGTEAELILRFTTGAPTTPEEPRLAALRPLHDGNPAGRALRLLEHVARGEEARLSLAILDDARLDVHVTPTCSPLTCSTVTRSSA